MAGKRSKKLAGKKTKQKTKVKKAIRQKQASKPVRSSKPAARKSSAVKAVAKLQPRSLKPAGTVVAKPDPKLPRGRPEELRDLALKTLDDMKGENIITVTLRGKSALYDYLIVASGRSSRQVAAMAEVLRGKFAAEQTKKLRVEGLPQGDWVVVDIGDVVIHVFRPEVRKYYNIEKIYGIESA